MVDLELEREQNYVATLYARLDALQREAEDQLTAVRLLDVGGNHQTRSERDTFARLYEDRIVQLREIKADYPRLAALLNYKTANPDNQYIATTVIGRDTTGLVEPPHALGCSAASRCRSNCDEV